MVVLQTHDLAIGYADGRKPRTVIAQHIHLSLHAGQLVCLLGANGTGKSTLMRTIAAMQKPLAGQVMLAGEPLHTFRPRQLARRLSVVLTDRPNLGLLNGYALVALGRHPYTDWTGRLSRYDRAMVQWAIEAVHASAFAQRPVIELSDGQRQKLMIARALAQESDMMLLDEPTAFLDLPRRAEMMHLLRHLAAETGRAILLSTHDLDLALRSADTLWVMAAGAVRAGTPEDLVLNGTFEAAFGGAGVRFDRATGAFSVERRRGRSVVVKGQGVPHTWTRRALMRAGYTLLAPHSFANPNGDAHIRLSGDDAHPIWHLRWHGSERTYHSIGDVLSAMAELPQHEPEGRERAG